MIKKCNVILHNSACTVVDYDGKQLQLPFLTNLDVVYVKFENQRYEIVSEKDYENSQKQLSKKIKTMDAELADDIVKDTKVIK